MATKYYNSYYQEFMQYFSLPLHFVLFLTIIFLFLTFTWYANYDFILGDFMDQIKLSFMVFPVLLLLLVHWLGYDRTQWSNYGSDKDSLHRAGGSPLGVAILLIFLMFMTYHHTSLQERWFPLFSRR